MANKNAIPCKRIAFLSARAFGTLFEYRGRAGQFYFSYKQALVGFWK